MLQSGYDSLRGICGYVSNRYVTAAVFTKICVLKDQFLLTDCMKNAIHERPKIMAYENKSTLQYVISAIDN